MHSISRRIWSLVLLAATVLLWPPRALVAAEPMQAQLADGTLINYIVALPPGYQENRSYPILLALPPGRQTLRMAEAGLRRFWGIGAEKKGFVVISPAAPKGKPYYKTGAALIPGFLAAIEKIYKVQGGRFHIAGSSNGGVSAFAIARRTPKLFQSLTALAGFPEAPEDFQRLDRLGGLKITMIVGDGDLYWKEGMQKTVARLEQLGQNPYFEIIPRNGHFLPDLSGPKSGRIFDIIGRPR